MQPQNYTVTVRENSDSIQHTPNAAVIVHSSRRNDFLSAHHKLIKSESHIIGAYTDLRCLEKINESEMQSLHCGPYMFLGYFSCGMW